MNSPALPLPHNLADEQLEQALRQPDAAAVLWGAATEAQVKRCCRLAASMQDRLAMLGWFAQHRSATLLLALLWGIVQLHGAEALEAEQLHSAVTTIMSRLLSQPVELQVLSAGLQDLLESLPEELRRLCAFYQPLGVAPTTSEAAGMMPIHAGNIELDADACNADLLPADFQLPVIAEAAGGGRRRAKRSTPSPRPFGEVIHQLNSACFGAADVLAEQWSALCVELISSSGDDPATCTRRWLQYLQSVADVLTTATTTTATTANDALAAAGLCRVVDTVWRSFEALRDKLIGGDEEQAIQTTTATLTLVSSVWARLLERTVASQDDEVLSRTLGMACHLCSALAGSGIVAARAAVSCLFVATTSSQQAAERPPPLALSPSRLIRCHGCNEHDGSCAVSTCILSAAPPLAPELLLPASVLATVFAELWKLQSPIPVEYINVCEPVAAVALSLFAVAAFGNAPSQQDDATKTFDRIVQAMQSAYLLTKSDCKLIAKCFVGTLWLALEHVGGTDPEVDDDAALAVFSGFCCAICCMGNDSMAEVLRWASAQPSSTAVLLVLLDGARRWKQILGATQQYPAHEHAIELFVDAIQRSLVSTAVLPSRLTRELAGRWEPHASTPRLDRHLPSTISIEPTRLLYTRSMHNELTFQDLPLPQHEWFRCSSGTQGELLPWSALRLDRLLSAESDVSTSGVGNPFGIPSEYAKTVFAVHAIAQQSSLRFVVAGAGSGVPFVLSAQHPSDLEDVVAVYRDMFRFDVLVRLVDDHLQSLCDQLARLYDTHGFVADRMELHELLNQRAVWEQATLLHACSRLIRLLPAATSESTVTSGSEQAHNLTKLVCCLLHRGGVAFAALSATVGWLLEAVLAQLDQPGASDALAYWSKHPGLLMAAGIATFNPLCRPEFLASYDELVRQLLAADQRSTGHHQHQGCCTILAKVGEGGISRSTIDISLFRSQPLLLQPNAAEVGVWRRLRWCPVSVWVLPSDVEYAAILVELSDTFNSTHSSNAASSERTPELRWARAFGVMTGTLVSGLFACRPRMQAASQVAIACLDTHNDHPVFRELLRTLATLNCEADDAAWLVNSLAASSDVHRATSRWSSELLACSDTWLAHLARVDEVEAVRLLTRWLAALSRLLSLQAEKTESDIYATVSFAIALLVRVFDGLVIEWQHRRGSNDPRETALRHCLFVLRVVLAEDATEAISHHELDGIVKQLRRGLAAVNRVQLVAEMLSCVRTEECAAALVRGSGQFNHDWLAWSLDTTVELMSTAAPHSISEPSSLKQPRYAAAAPHPPLSPPPLAIVEVQPAPQPESAQEAWSLPPEMWSQFGL